MADHRAAERYMAAIEDELNHERAALLGRYGRRVESALARCAELLHSLGSEPDEQALEQYRTERRNAIQAISTLCVQREMLGLHDHSSVSRVFPTPPSR